MVITPKDEVLLIVIVPGINGYFSACRTFHVLAQIGRFSVAKAVSEVLQKNSINGSIVLFLVLLTTAGRVYRCTAHVSSIMYRTDWAHKSISCVYSNPGDKMVTCSMTLCISTIL